MSYVAATAYRARLYALLPLLVGAMFGACASAGMNAQGDPTAVAEEEGEGPQSVVVDNQGWDHVTVYIRQDAATWRLGDVEPSSRRQFPLRALSSALRNRTTFLVARPLAGTSFSSEPFELIPRGGTPVWTIRTYAPLSSIMFR